MRARDVPKTPELGRGAIPGAGRRASECRMGEGGGGGNWKAHWHGPRARREGGRGAVRSARSVHVRNERKNAEPISKMH